MNRSIKRWETFDQIRPSPLHLYWHCTVGRPQVCRCLVSHSWGWDCKQMATLESESVVRSVHHELRVFIQLWPRIRGEVQAVQAVTQLFVRKWISISEQCWRRPVMPVIRGGSDNSFRLQVIRDKQENIISMSSFYIFIPRLRYSFWKFPDSFCNINICRIWEIYISTLHRTALDSYLRRQGLQIQTLSRKSS